MMRYRRNRASTLEGATQQAAPNSSIPSSNYQNVPGANNKGNWSGNPTDLSAGGNTPWAVYQNGAGSKPASSQIPAQSAMMGAQSSSVRKTNAMPSTTAGAVNTQSSGWSSAFTGDRPKSANVMGPTSGGIISQNSGGGIMASLTGSRPSSSTQPIPAGGNVMQNSGSGQWGSSPAANANSAGLNSATNSNTLSYGSLKNRFLSGSSNKNTSVPATAATNQNTATASSGKSKLFSLAR